MHRNGWEEWAGDVLFYAGNTLEQEVGARASRYAEALRALSLRLRRRALGLPADERPRANGV